MIEEFCIYLKLDGKEIDGERLKIVKKGKEIGR